MIGPLVDTAQGGFGISLASHRWPEAKAAAVEVAGHHLGTWNTAERQQERHEEHH